MNKLILPLILFALLIGGLSPVLPVMANPGIVVQTAHGGHSMVGGENAVSLLFPAATTSGNLLLFGISSEALTANSPVGERICEEPANTCTSFSILTSMGGDARFQVGCALAEICDSEVWFGYVSASNQNYTAILSDASIKSDIFGLELKGTVVDNNPFGQKQGGGGDCNLVSNPTLEPSTNALVFSVASTSGAGASWSINDPKFTLVGSTENSGNAAYSTTSAGDTIPTTTAIHNPTASTCGVQTVSLRSGAVATSNVVIITQTIVNEGIPLPSISVSLSPTTVAIILVASLLVIGITGIALRATRRGR